MAPKKILSRTFFSLFILAIVATGVQIVIQTLVSNFKPEIAETNWYVWAITAISLIVIGFPIYYLVIRAVPDSPRGEVIRMKPSSFIVYFFICVAAMYITNFFSLFITFAISLIKGEALANPAADAILGGNFIISLIYAAIIAPIFEELIFRKLLLNKLRRFGDIPAILMTGLAFGLFHFNLVQFFYAAVLGFLFAYIAIRTNTVIYSIILHMMINFISTVFTPFVTDMNIIAMMAIGVWVLVSITLGVIFFIINIKNIKLERTAPLIKKSAYFLNTGTILYTAACLAFITIITVLG